MFLEARMLPTEHKGYLHKHKSNINNFQGEITDEYVLEGFHNAFAHLYSPG